MEQYKGNIEIKKDDRFETFFNKDDFYKNINSIDELRDFRKFLIKKVNIFIKNEKDAESRYKNSPELKEYIDLKDKSYKLDQFMYNELDVNSKEWKEKEKEVDELETRAGKILKDNQEINKIYNELSDSWDSATKQKNDFLKNNKISYKLEIIDKVLIPYFDQKIKVNYFLKEKQSELDSLRDLLYEKLENNKSKNKDYEEKIEEEIKQVEKEIKNLPLSIKIEKSKFERMEEVLNSTVNMIYKKYF